jgi:hypothetical protein
MGQKLSDADIHDAGRLKHTHKWRRVQQPDGTWAIEKKPMGRSEKWIDKHGNCCHIVLVDAAAERRNVLTENRRRRELRRDGGIPYAQCPLRDSESVLREADFPPELRSPCALPPPGVPNTEFGEHQSCMHVEYITKERQEKQRKHNQEREDLRRREEMRREAELQMQKDQNEMMRDLLSKVADKLVDEKPRGKK